MFKRDTSVDKALSNVEIDIILCSLFTLTPTHKFFRNINFKNDLYLIKGESYLLSNKEKFKELYNLLNESYLRQLAYDLLEPFITKQHLLPEQQKRNESLYEQTALLKKYLRRFNFIYNRYFLTKNCNYNLLPTDKEINFFAIKSLFLLTGI